MAPLSPSHSRKVSSSSASPWLLRRSSVSSGGALTSTSDTATIGSGRMNGVARLRGSMDVEEGIETTSPCNIISSSDHYYYDSDATTTGDPKVTTSTSATNSDSIHPNRGRGTFSQLVIGALGIYVAYLYYGDIQEDIFRFEDKGGERFTYVWFLQMLESLMNMAVGYAIKRYNTRSTKTTVSPAFPLFPFYSSGTSQLFSKVFTSLSLAAGLSFPVCTLAKCAKIVPVMIGEIVMGGTKYKTNDYLYACAIVFGTTLLSLSRSSSSSTAQQQHTTTLGIVMILLSLAADGATAGLQRKMITGNQDLKEQPKSYDFLLYTNLAMAVLAFFIAIATGDLFDGYAFLEERPGLSIMISQLCMCSAVGQVFVFYIIANFSPQMCAIITTSRKILSVGWSIAMKGHFINTQGTVGLAIALVGMVLEIHSKVKKCGKRPGPSDIVRGTT